MDPQANLTRQRQLVKLILEMAEEDAADIYELRAMNATEAALAEELAALVSALDEWRLQGGFDPYATPEVTR